MIAKSIIEIEQLLLGKEVIRRGRGESLGQILKDSTRWQNIFFKSIEKLLLLIV
jgi:hypothetical protein